MRDPIVEAHLSDRLVKYTYLESVPLKAFNEKMSLQNQARFEPLHEDVVARYAEAMERGDQFPAVVGARTSKEEIVLIDGNHRYQGAKRANRTELDVYIVQANAETLQLLTFEANARHGMPPSNEERTRHAIYLIDNGMTQEAAAAATGLLKSTVTSAWQAERADRRARQLGMTRGWSRLTKDQRERLAGIASDAGFIEATKLVIDGRLSTVETRRICQELKPLRSDRAQIERIREVRESYEQAHLEPGVRTGRVVMDARRNLIPHLGYFQSFDIEAVVNATITPHQFEDLFNRIGEAKAAIELLQESLEQRQKERAEDA